MLKAVSPDTVSAAVSAVKHLVANKAPAEMPPDYSSLGFVQIFGPKDLPDAARLVVQKIEEATKTLNVVAGLQSQFTVVAQGQGKIEQHIEAVAHNQLELLKENAELRRLNQEGYFNFAVRVKGQDFLAFAVIMALGNRKAAAAHLKVPHRSFYDRVNRWARGNQDQQRMFRLVEWRKKTGRKIVVRLEDSVQSGEPNDEPENPVTVAAVLEGIATTDAKDYPTILREILEVLAQQNAKNWAVLKAEAMKIIREEVGQ